MREKIQILVDTKNSYNVPINLEFQHNPHPSWQPMVFYTKGLPRGQKIWVLPGWGGEFEQEE